MTADDSAGDLDCLAELAGIESVHRDYFGRQTVVSQETKRALLRALGFPVDDPAGLASALRSFAERSWWRALEPVCVTIAPDPIRVGLTLTQAAQGDALEWWLTEECGRSHRGVARWDDLPVREERALEGRSIERRELEIGIALPFGYHRLEVGDLGTTSVIVAPKHCFLSRPEAGKERTWGLAIQLYALSSPTNWGVGDFSDLREIAQVTASAGGASVALNPLHELDPANPAAASPYAPSSRLHLNVASLDVEAIPDFAECSEARRIATSPAFAARLSDLRAAPLVDYESVATCKRAILDVLFAWFRRHHLERKTARGRAFQAFVEAGGPALQQLATFETLREHFSDPPFSFGPAAWPQAFRDCTSQAVAKFSAVHSERVQFFAYLQWNADVQLAAAERACAEMPVGLFRDLAVGASPDGAEAWSDPATLLRDVTLGAPSDPLNVHGQSWGLAPQSPIALRERAYAPFSALIRANMRYAGALRIDHVMGWQRQFWIPVGHPPSDGAYVRFPLADLLAVVALESARNTCIVVGEDLGTLPDGFRETMRDSQVLSSRLLYFERAEDGEIAAPEQYPTAAVVSPGTHDLPTLPAFWTARDVQLRATLGLLPVGESPADALAHRESEREAFLSAFLRAHALGIDVATRLRSAGASPEPADLRALVAAAYRYLARSPSLMLTVSLDDMLGSALQVNVPGTVLEHPNWQHKAGVPISKLLQDAGFAAVIDAVRERASV